LREELGKGLALGNPELYAKTVGKIEGVNEVITLEWSEEDEPKRNSTSGVQGSSKA